MNRLPANGLQPVRALAWEFWARGWRGQMLGLAGVVGFASLLYGAIYLESDLTFRGTEVGTAMHFGFFWVTVFALGAPILLAWGAPQRRYTLPTSSFVVVAFPMVCSMLSMFVLYAVAAMTLNVLCDAGWPIWGPGLVAAISVAWLQAVLWSTSNSQGLQLVSCAASFGVLLFGVMKLASPGRPASGWFHADINTSHVLVLGLATLACVVVGTLGFANLRRGNGLNVNRIVNRIVDRARRLFPKTARATPFSSSTSAQFWLEWRERGYGMPVATVVFGAAVLLFTYFVSPDFAGRDAGELIGGVSTILWLLSFSGGAVSGYRSESGLIGNYSGSRPLTDSQIANAVLTSATVGVLASALIWATFMAAAWLIFQQRTGQSSLQSLIAQFESLRLLEFATLGARLIGFVMLGMGAIWGTVGLMTSLFLAGKKVGVGVVGTVFGVWIAGSIVHRLLISREAEATFGLVFVSLCVVLPLVGIAVAFVAGWWLKLISRNTLVLAAAIVAAMLAGVHLAGFTIEPGPYLLVLWACLLTPFPLAAAPLAVWWNRHR